jgi:prepilin-type N-terminal cleavage/methylation domain-containing protein
MSERPRSNPRTTRRNPRRRGFTLVEVIVSIVLLSLLTAGVATLISDLRLRRDAILDLGAANRAADALIAAIESDLPTTFVATRDGQPGISGNATSLTIRSSVTPLSLDADATPTGEHTRSRFAFERASGVLKAARGPASQEPSPTDMTDRLADLRFRYHDGQAWRSSFDSAASGTLPVAVEVIVLFGGRGDDTPGPRNTDADLPTDAPAPADAPPTPDGPAALDAPPDDPFADWLARGRRRVIAIPDSGIEQQSPEAGAADASAPPNAGGPR